MPASRHRSQTELLQDAGACGIEVADGEDHMIDPEHPPLSSFHA